MTKSQSPSIVPITENARRQFSPEQVNLIGNTVGKECSPPELHMFLEIAARLELNPFVGEIYAAKMPGKNGGGGRIAFIVGRDGFIKIANRHTPDRNPHDFFEGMDGDVVREKDTFEVQRVGGDRQVAHSYAGNHKARGPIVGAWAEVQRHGRPAVYFYAPIEEYKPTSAKKLEFSPWGTQESVMMLKCAQSTAMRIAFDVSGVYSEGELAHAMVAGAPESSEPEIEWGDDALGAWLRDCVEEANRAKPGSYRPAKVQMRLQGKSEDERVEFGNEVCRVIEANGGDVPEMSVDGTAAEAA